MVNLVEKELVVQSTTIIGNIYTTVDITKSIGNVSVTSGMYANIFTYAKKLGKKVVLGIDDWGDDICTVSLDGEEINRGSVVTTLRSQGFVGVADKLEGMVNKCSSISKIDIATALMGSDVLKDMFGLFVFYELLSKDEIEELK